MTLRPLLISLLLLPTACGPAADGRGGNRLYARGKYTAAAAAYTEGRATLGPDASGAVAYGLANNLGAAHYRTGDLPGAARTFADALRLAPAAADSARTYYNAGNTAYAQDDPDGALARFRRALLADPQNEDARHNYEVVKRMLSQRSTASTGQGQQSGGAPQPQPQPGGNQPQQGGQPNGQPDRKPNAQPQPAPPPPQQAPRQQAQQPGGTPSPADGSTPADAPERLSRDEAERILDALEQDERDLLRRTPPQPDTPRQVQKDW